MQLLLLEESRELLILILCTRLPLMHCACRDASRRAVTIFLYSEKMSERALRCVRLTRGYHFQLQTTLSIT